MSGESGHPRLCSGIPGHDRRLAAVADGLAWLHPRHQPHLAIDVERYEGAIDLRVIPPLCPIRTTPIDFSRASQLIESGFESTQAWLSSRHPSRGKAALLERVAVRLTHERTHAEDCADPETKPCIVDHIDRSLTLDGPLTDDQRTALLGIAERCPVHRTLTGEIRVDTVLT